MSQSPSHNPGRVVSLFSGIGGLDVGLERAGFEIAQMCESWDVARKVLQDRFPSTPVDSDVRHFVPDTDYTVLTAGFPCTDLSHAGGKAGIFGPQSGLVDHVFRIARATRPRHIVLENVPNLLRLHGGAGIESIVSRLEELGYRWAYRTVDARFTGVPQRRFRVIVLASLDHDPSGPLLGQDYRANPRASPEDELARGFYWTEGRTGLGLVPGAVPTLKGGSMLGTPSAPAIWFPDSPVGRKFVLPRVEDAEALQGFERGWTRTAHTPGQRDLRWKLLGNAVPTGISQWLGERLGQSVAAVPAGPDIASTGRWPKAATGAPGVAPAAVDVGTWPVANVSKALREVVPVDLAPTLSHRAAKGFLSRLDESQLAVPAKFYEDLEAHIRAHRPRIANARERAPLSSPQKRTTTATLREALAAQGVRYRLDARPVRRMRHRYPFVFGGARVAVDVRDCFWRGCPEHSGAARPDVTRWQAKIDRVASQHVAAERDLAAEGWIVHVVWEHENPRPVADVLSALVAARMQSSIPEAADGPEPATAEPRSLTA